MPTKYDIMLALLGLFGASSGAMFAIDALRAAFTLALCAWFLFAWLLFIDPPRDPAFGPHH